MYSIAVSYKGNKSKLTFNTNHVKIEDFNNILQEIIDIEFIYGLHYDKHKINIHVVTRNGLLHMKQSTNDYIELKWGLCIVTCEVEDICSTTATTDAVIRELQAHVLPEYGSFCHRKFIPICNPASGSRKSLQHWKTIVKPMLLNAGYKDSDSIKIITTAKDGKTRDIAMKLGQTLKENGAINDSVIICLGGDGTIHDVINGLSDSATNNTTVHFSVIPSGSGNSFALGLGIESIEHATLKIIKGKFKPFHSMNVSIGRSLSIEENWADQVVFDESIQKLRLFVVMSWGFHAQIVSKSRYLQYFMGNRRFTLVAGFLLTFLQQYEGDLVLTNAKKYRVETKDFGDTTDKVIIRGCNDGLDTNPPFTYFVVSKQHSFERGFKIAPFASPLSEDMDVVMVRGASAASLLKVLDEASHKGSHINDTTTVVEYYKVKELLLRVKKTTELCLDGEIHTIPNDGVVQLSMDDTSPDNTHFEVSV